MTTLKLIILKTNITEALAALERAVSSNTNLPILKNVLLRTENGKIFFVATNLEIAVTCLVQGKIIENGEVTVPFALFSSVARNLTAERITLEQKEKQLVITTDNYDATIQTQEAKEFPIIPAIHNRAQSIRLPAPRFLEALQSVLVATQYSEIRPEISGVFLRVSDGKLIFAATDSFRLAERILDANEIGTEFEEVSFIVPFRTAEELARFLGGAKNNVEIFIDPNQVLFKIESRELISRLVDGTFPEYRAIIPKVCQNEAGVERNEFANAIKLSSSFTGRTNDITVTVGENKKYIDLHSADPSLGENHYKIHIKMKGDAFSIAFNWRYLLDGLKVFSGKEIVLGVNAANRPAVLRSQEDQQLTYVVMPINN